MKASRTQPRFNFALQARQEQEEGEGREPCPSVPRSHGAPRTTAHPTAHRLARAPLGSHPVLAFPHVDDQTREAT